MNPPLIRKRMLLLLLVQAIITGCSDHNAPDVSGISVTIKVERFDKFMFEKIDTNNIGRGFLQLQNAFPHFTKDFIINILGLPYGGTITSDSAAAVTLSELKRFISVTKPLYDSLAPRFERTDWLENELTQGFRYVKYYFPGYTIPKVLTYVGPFNSPGIAITNEALAIGLQLYAGRDFSFYTSTQGQEIFPAYISRNFEPQYITVNAMRAVVEDLHMDKSAARPLVEQMIEKGKQWFLLNKFLPKTPDSLKTGYTAEQLNWCKKNEGLIWNYFLQGNDLYSTEPSLIKDYIGEAPSTQGIPQEAPGNIGQWIGWQIVEKYAAKNTGLSPDALMKTDAKKILSEAKYRPR